MASGPISSWQIDGETMETVWDLILGGSKITADGDCSHEIKRHMLLGRKVITNLVSILKSRDFTLSKKGPYSQSYVFSSCHVRMWQLDCKESWAPKNWCFWTMVLEKTLESPLNYKEIQPVHPKGDQSRVFTEGLMLKLKLQYFGHLMWSHEIKRHMLLGRKVMTNLDSILKSRDITLTTNIHLIKALVIPVVMYGCESWNIKKAEGQRIDACELWCWRRLLRVPWMQGDQTNQS